MREEMRRKSVDFTIKTIQEYDIVEPKDLMILFEYRVDDQGQREEEAEVVTKEFKVRDMDPKNNILEKISLENGTRKRKLRKKIL